MPGDVDPGMAFVLVQHLAPDHKSLLSELIRRCTRMQVFEVDDGVVVQPSFYGTDNTVLLNALAQAGGALVGVGAVPDDVSDSQLDALALAGVRGLRFAQRLCWPVQRSAPLR